MGKARGAERLPTLERVREVLDYDPKTGLFIWAQTLNQRRRKGAVAGYVRPDGRRLITIGRVRMYSNRLAWFYVHGAWPRNEIDHEDADFSNDRIANLREATRSQNSHNTGRHKDNSSGLKGIHCGRTGRWFAQIQHDGVRYSLGGFATAQEAHDAYAEAKRRMAGAFARTD